MLEGRHHGTLASVYRFCRRARVRVRVLGVTGALVCAALSPPLLAFGGKNSPPPTLRWAEGQPGCTFSRDHDGKYRYALWTPDYGVILAVDSQELQLHHKRVERFLSVHVTVRYRGQGSLAVYPKQATLEFVKHSKVIQPAVDPQGFAQKTQADADEVEYQTKREIEKHPERKEEREKYVEEYKRNVIELVDFLSRRTLPAAQLDTSHPEVSGWLLFSTRNKWIGEWKKPEEFVLRLPLAGQIVEFPFELPPRGEDLILRQRSN